MLLNCVLVIFFFPYNPTPLHPDKPPRPSHPRELDFGPFRLRFGPFPVRLAPFGSVLGLFRVRFGVLGGVGVGSGRGASVREKNITTVCFCTVQLAVNLTHVVLTSGVRKRVVSRRVALAGVPWTPKKGGDPQTCVYPDVCLGIAHVSGKAPLPAQGVWQIHNVSALFALQESVGRKGADTLCIYQTPCPGRGALPDTWAIPKHTSG